MKLTTVQLLNLRIRSRQEVLTLKRKVGISSKEHFIKLQEINAAVRYLEKRYDLNLNAFTRI